MRTIRPKQLWGFQELRPHISYTGYWDFDDFQQTEFIHVDNHWEWRNAYEVHTGRQLHSRRSQDAFRDLSRSGRTAR